MKIKSSYLWAGAIVVVIGVWLSSDNLSAMLNEMRAEAGAATSTTATTTPGVAAAAAPGTTPDPSAGTAESTEAEPLQTVRVAVLRAEQRHAQITLRGRTEALRKVVVRGETTGTVTATPIAKGAFVSRGQILCRLDMADREAQLQQASAAVEWAEAEFEAKSKLGTKGFSARNQVSEMRASLDASRAALRKAELDIARTEIVAPFDGVIEERSAEIGSYIGIGGACATIVELSPMKVVGHVSEREVGALSRGMPATAKLATGQTVEGQIRFIGSSADTQTRTFRIEIEIPNADRSAKDGVTAEILIPLQPIEAVRLSPAVLALNDAGIVGVRTVDETDAVAFVPVEIIASGDDGVWVTGLPPAPAVITVGHEYVVEGQKVQRVEDTRTAAAGTAK